MEKTRFPGSTLLLAAAVSCSHASALPPATWEAPRASGTAIQRSDENARVLLAIQAKFTPESAARLGVPGLDDRITDLTPGYRERARQATREALAELERRREAERDPLVAQDLRILIHSAQLQIRGSELNEQYEVP